MRKGDNLTKLNQERILWGTWNSVNILLIARKPLEKGRYFGEIFDTELLNDFVLEVLM